MADYPIIFSAPMIRALLERRKVQTRRLAWREVRHDVMHVNGQPTETVVEMRPSPWQKVRPGDRLWVRENWYAAHGSEDIKPRDMSPDWRICPAVDWSYTDWGIHGKLRPAIHMPRWASRITLTVTDVRRQRLQEISGEDVIAEGIDPAPHRCGCERCAMTSQLCPATASSLILGFFGLWDHLHGDGAWDANPEIVRLSFSVAKINIDAQEAA